MFFTFVHILHMPSHGVYFNDNEFDAVTAAAAMSKEGSVSPYIAEAVRIRMKREGIQHNDPRTALWAAVEEIGPTRALEILSAQSR